MKKIISLLICASILMTSMCIFAAASNESFTYKIDENEYTVEINDADISIAKKQTIANALVGMNESDIMPVNILCDIFGHDYKYTTATVTQHKVSTYNPRCKLFTYDVTYCEDCDYTEQTLLGTSYINCCPED